MPRPAITWQLIAELAREIKDENPRLWKHRGKIPDGARWRLYNAARKRRIILTDADFDAVVAPKPRSFVEKWTDVINAR